jgi:dimethylargininase
MRAEIDKKFFTHAIVRTPTRSFSAGITTAQLGKPDYKRAIRQHSAYCEVLKKCGLRIIYLEEEPLYPDATFVEDTAIIAGKSAIITRLGHSYRRGEEKRVAEELKKYFNIKVIKAPGTIDGGDILRIDNHYYIGISKRTNENGAKQAARFLSKEGFSYSFILVKNILHLKTGVTYIGSKNILAIEQFAKRNEFKRFNIIVVPKSEFLAANCLFVNNNLLIPRGFFKTKKKIQNRGFKSIEIDVSEFQKMDGGLTCLSILF